MISCDVSYNSARLARIEEKSIPEPNTGCILFTGKAQDKFGYPQMHFRGKTKYVFHVALHVIKGIPWGAFSIHFPFDHKCNNRQCINVDHIEQKTQRDNIVRGNSPSAINSRKTHCISGHELSGENLTGRIRRGRECRICRNKQSLVRYYRDKK